MRLFKFSSIMVLSFLFMWAFVPHLSAKHHGGHHHHHSYKKRSSSFSLNFNILQPSYCEYVKTPVRQENTTIVVPYRPYVEERVYYPVYREVVVQQPAYKERVYIHPQFSYYSSWGR